MGIIGIAFGGPAPEHDISILTGLQVARLLSDAGHETICLYWRKNGEWLALPPTAEARDFLEPVPPRSRPVEVALGAESGFVERKKLRSTTLDIDVVVNCCHGGPGENGVLPAMLAAVGIPCTGPQSIAAGIAMDKHATNLVARGLGVPVADQALLTSDTTEVPFDGPYIVKPRYGGSSIGIETVHDVSTATDLLRTSAHLAGGAVIERFLEGWVDVNISVRTSPALQLSAIERPLRPDDGVYSYEEKYLQGQGALESAPRELPAVLPEGVEAGIRSAAETVTRATGLTGIARIDFLWDTKDRVIFNEVNSIPGAMSFYLWRATGVEPVRLILDAISEAKADAPFKRWSTAGADSRALRSADSIAAKLA